MSAVQRNDSSSEHLVLQADAEALLLHVPADVRADIDIKLARTFASQATGNVCAMSSFIGGVAAQEAMKAVTGIFTPINQWFYFDALECLPGEWSEFNIATLTKDDVQPVSNYSAFAL